MLSTPIKIKQETTEVTHARVKFDGVLQNLIERADGSLPLDDEISIKDEDFDRSFEDDIRELEATPVTKSPSKSRKRKKRDFASSDVEQLDENIKSRNSFVMKLFDRSVDLASFRPNAPLYPVCRAWMSNSPTAKMPRRDLSPSPEPLPDSDVSENGLIYRLPSPGKTCSEMTEELSRDPRIPSPVPQPEETLDIHADSSQAPSKETLLNGHLQRWRVIRNKTEPYKNSFYPRTIRNEINYQPPSSKSQHRPSLSIPKLELHLWPLSEALHSVDVALLHLKIR